MKKMAENFNKDDSTDVPKNDYSQTPSNDLGGITPGPAQGEGGGNAAGANPSAAEPVSQTANQNTAGTFYPDAQPTENVAENPIQSPPPAVFKPEGEETGQIGATPPPEEDFKMPAEQEFDLKTEPEPPREGGTEVAGMAGPASGATTPEKKPTYGGNAETSEQFGEGFETKRNYFPIILISILVILLVLAGLIFVNEYGIANLGLEKVYGAVGLEKLWGGLGNDGKAALAKSATAMKTVKSMTNNLDFDYQGESLVLAGTTGGTQTSLKGKGVVENSGSDFQTDLSLDLSGLTSGSFGITAAASEVTLNVIKKDDKIYVKAPALSSLSQNSGSKWAEITALSANTTSAAYDLSAYVDSGKRVGSDKVSGTAVYVYDVNLNSQKFILDRLGSTAANSLKGTITLKAKAYLGKKDHRLYKEVLNFVMSGEKSDRMQATLAVNKFNPGVNISAPNPTDIDPNGVLQLLTLTRNNDQKRKTDLASIAAALESYKTAKGSYPLTSGQLIKAGETNGALAKALVPQYLTTMPSDPNSTLWYGYTSDGTTYTLSCVLDNHSDPEGKQSGNLYLFFVKNPTT